MNCARCGAPIREAQAEEHRCESAGDAEAPPRRSENTIIHLVRPGDLLDERWRIETRIGQGAMGSVYLGIDSKRGSKVAVKILAPDHCRKPKVLARFEREARLMTTLRHPNIVQLLGVGRQGALPFIVMQYLEGETLADYLRGKGGKLAPVECLAIVRQICSGLSFVHHHGLVHRDIKPQNIFISSEGHVTILDLGVVRDRSNPGLTKPGAMVGTPYYMSPEQILGTAEIDRRTDVYALGAVTFELLTGTPPFVADSNFEVLYKHRTLPPPDASLLSSFVPKPVAAAINHALAKTPDERQQNVSELLADLEAGYCLDDDRTNPGFAFSFPEEPPSEAKKKKVRTGSLSSPLPAARPALVETAAAATSKPVARAASPSGSLRGRPAQAPKPRGPGPAPPPPQPPRNPLTGLETELRESDLSDRSTADGPKAADPNATVLETGELRVITTVKGLTTGATLLLDWVPKGTTPASIKVPAGVYTLRLERQGFKPIEKETVVSPNGVTLLRLELEKA